MLAVGVRVSVAAVPGDTACAVGSACGWQKHTTAEAGRVRWGPCGLTPAPNLSGQPVPDTPAGGDRREILFPHASAPH